MTKDNFISILRAVLLAVGSFLAGKALLGATIDDNLWQGIVGAVVGLGAMIWGIIDKTATIEMIQSSLRSAGIILGTLLIAAGKFNQQNLETILGAITAIIPVIYGMYSQKKSAAIANGKLGIADLKGVDEKKPENINPTIQTPPKN